MASISTHVRGGKYVNQQTMDGKRARIYLGRVPKKFAEEFARRVEELDRANRFNLLASDAVEWALRIDKRFREKLEHHGFLRVGRRVGVRLSQWIDEVIAKHTGEGSTKKGLRTARNNWVRLLGDPLLTEITRGKVKDAIAQLAVGCSSSHANRVCERGKMFLEAAVDHQLIAENPFCDVRFPKRIVNKERQSYVTRETFLQVVEKARHSEAQLLFLMARFGGLRIPSEPIALTWDLVDFEKMRFSIPQGTKTGFRVVPIFPEFEAELRQRFDQAAEGSKHLFTSCRRSAGTQWREWLEAAIRLAAVPQWPKIWHNLRASCRTDLEERFPAHVCDAWLGHTAKVARDHYLMVTPDHWESARTSTGSSARHSARVGSVSSVACGDRQTP